MKEPLYRYVKNRYTKLEGIKIAKLQLLLFQIIHAVIRVCFHEVVEEKETL